MGANQFIPIPLPNPNFQPFVDANLLAVTGVSNAASAVVSCPGHAFLAGDVVVIRGVLGMSDVPNGVFVVSLPVPGVSFKIGVSTLAVGAYGGGGQAALWGKRFIGVIDSAAPAAPIRIQTTDPTGAPIAHGLITTDLIKISGNTSMPEINGVWQITVTAPTLFTLDNTSYIGPTLTGNDGVIDENRYPVIAQTPTANGYSDGSVVEVRPSSSVQGEEFQITLVSGVKFKLDFDGEDVQFPAGGLVRQTATGLVDFISLVAPSGVEKRKTFTVAGDYSGRLIFEGTMDGVSYSPFLLFDEGKPGGVKTVEVNVPGMRVRGEGLVINSGAIVGFMGAEQNCACDPAWSDHGANVYATMNVPDPTVIPLDREDPIQIESTSATTPVVVTTLTPHPYVNGETVRVSGVEKSDGTLLTPSVNGLWVITYISPTSFSLGGSVGIAAGIGGQVELVTAPNTTPYALVTAFPHGYNTGDTVRVVGVVDDETLLNIVSAFSPNNATLVTITTVGVHGYATGNRVHIQDNTALPNGDYKITVTGGTTFTLDGIFGPINGAGGTCLRFPGADGDFVITVLGPTAFQLVGSVGTGNGTGGNVQALASVGINTSTFKSEKTLQLQGGPYTGTFIPEGTLDTGGSPVYLPLGDLFNVGGPDEKLELDALFAKMRIRPDGAEGNVSIWIGSQLACACPDQPPPGMSAPKLVAPKPSVKSRIAAMIDRKKSSREGRPMRKAKR